MRRIEQANNFEFLEHKRSTCHQLCSRWPRGDGIMRAMCAFGQSGHGLLHCIWVFFDPRWTSHAALEIAKSCNEINRAAILIALPLSAVTVAALLLFDPPVACPGWLAGIGACERWLKGTPHLWCPMNTFWPACAWSAL